MIIKNFIKAARLRTLPLSISGIILGGFLAMSDGLFNGVIFSLALITTIGFQVISNFANDYGDGVKGTDAIRIGEERMVSSGKISPKQMKKAIMISVILTIIFALFLIYESFGLSNFGYSVLFFILGIVSVVAAIKYTVGNLIYDAQVYDGMNTCLKDLEFYKRWLPKNKEARILELCCGTGRLTIPIAKDNYDITGVDFTTTMLEQAKINATKAGLDITFIEADIRTLNLEEKFDLIFIPFNSIHHLYKNEDLFNALSSVKNHLKAEGLFLLDCFNPNIQYTVESEKKEQDIAKYTTKDGRAISIKQKMRYESKTQINRIEWYYFINGKFNSIQNLDMRLFFPQELDSYLKSNGFNIIKKFGDFNETLFSDHSEKPIFVCQ